MRGVAPVIISLFMFSIFQGTANAQDSGWADMAPAAGPSPTEDHDVAYGQTDGEPSMGPSGWAFPSMAYDTDSDRVILFGGLAPPTFTTQFSSSNETWAYDFNSNTWTNVTPAAGPPARGLHAMAYDAASDRVILFGGLVGPTPGSLVRSADTWSYDFNTNSWTNMTRSVGPSARVGHAMVYDAESDRVIMFGGGVDPNLDFTTSFADTWSYDFDTNSWVNMDPAERPSARHEHAMAYDAASDRVLLFGGWARTPTTVGFSDETWAYDFNINTWTNVTPAVGPPARAFHAMACDAVSDRIVLFGGGVDPNFAYFADTWSYDFDTDSWTNMTRSAGPSPRVGPAMAYDAASDRIILFGGLAEITVGHPAINDTWSYDLNTNTWTEVTLLPSAPQILRATAGNTQVTLAWEAPLSSGRSTITNYRVYRGTAPGDADFLVERLSTVLSFRDTGLTNGVAYYYQVSAVNAAGEGPRSNEASATPVAPLAPDTTKPTILIISPEGGSTLSSTFVVVSGTAADDEAVDIVEISPDGTNYVLATGTVSWTGTLTLAEGPNTIFARATDTSGNTATVSIAVTVVTPTPGRPISSLGIAVGIGALVAAVAGVAALLILRSLGKRRGGA